MIDQGAIRTIAKLKKEPRLAIMVLWGTLRAVSPRILANQVCLRKEEEELPALLRALADEIELASKVGP